MQPHQVNVPPSTSLTKSISQGQSQQEPIISSQQPKPQKSLKATSKASGAASDNSSVPQQPVPKQQQQQSTTPKSINPAARPIDLRNVYSNAYSKKSTAELIRQRLSITSPSKKKGGQQGFSHSDEMQYKRHHLTKLIDFQIIQKLGDGAYSSVYKVRRIEDGQCYALKKVKIGAQSHKDKENAINEVRILSSLKHPNVVAYKEAFIDNDSQTLNLVMQLADGGDLLKMISDRKKRKVHFRESQVWRVLIETVYGLKAMHELSVMHRDIKSANIFLFRNSEERHKEDGGNLYQAKLGDMNVSKVTAQNGLNYTQTGTPYYASPEVWKDEPYGYKSDVWSLGCVIYEMLSLKPPFSGRDMDHLYKRVCKGVFPRIPDHYSNDIWAVVQLMLQVDPQKRPDCDQLISSKMFQIYTEKLRSLESVDKTFQKTLKSTSPDRAQIKQITNSLLTQLHLPANDISSLTNMLPMHNYESSQADYGKNGSLSKNNGGDSQFRSSTSRKLQLIRNQHQQQQNQQQQIQPQQSRQKTQIQKSGTQADSETTNANDVELDQISPLLKQKGVKKQNSSNLKGNHVHSTSSSPKMTKIQTKLQRQYLVKKESHISIGPQTGSESQNNNRSQNPTIITNRSSSKQSKLQQRKSDANSGNEQANNDAAGSVVSKDNSLRHRLNSKRKNVLTKEDVNDVVSQDYGETQVEQVQQSNTRKAGSVIKNNTSKAMQEQKFKSIERPGQNITPLKSQDSNKLLSHASPGYNEAKGNSIKQSRLSLPVVASLNNVASKLADSAESTPTNPLKLNLHLKNNSITEAVYNNSSDAKHAVTQLPQLSEQESDVFRSADYKGSPTAASGKNQAKSPTNRTDNMPSVVKVNNSIYNGSTISKNHQVITEQVEFDEGEYSSSKVAVAASASLGNKIRQGKRHASYDILVPQTNGSQIFQHATPHALHQLVASQGALPVQNQNENSQSRTSRLPESQSYSQINMVNSALPLTIQRAQGSTSSSEEVPQPTFVATGTNSEVKIKHNLRQRVNIQNSGGYGNISSSNTKAGTYDYRAAQHQRPSIQSQHIDMPIFSKNQQSSVRHQQSDANFSLNSEELRHGGFQIGVHNVPPTEHNSQKRIVENYKIRLPQIDNRKKSLEAASQDYSRQGKLHSNFQNAAISKKKPSHGGQSLQPSSIYASIGTHSNLSNGNLSLIQHGMHSNKNLNSVKNHQILHNHHSPVNGLNQNSSSQVRNASHNNQLQPSAQIAIKKKTLAAYANPRARNNQRNNLIYTQKHNTQGNH